MAYPVKLNDVKQHLHIDSNIFDYDQYIEDFIIPTATEMCNIFVDPSTLLTDASCAPSVRQAILVTCGDLFIKRNSDELGQTKKSDILLRLQMPHKKIYW